MVLIPQDAVREVAIDMTLDMTHEWILRAAAHSEGPDGIRRWALFGPGRVHRYALWRSWGEGGQVRSAVVFVLLNPSTADERVDDPTIRRCIGYAKRWGHDMACILNIFAYRSTDPRVLRQTDDPVGIENDAWIKSATSYEQIVLAWGAHGVFMQRGARVRELLFGVPNMFHFGLTGNGQPRHLLYLPKDARLVAA